ncbi:alpha/beta hydrolase [Croceicoccus gelatinilyticus]|uniref:alpha/beta hydrolase n=1 Tax=Croceicoccus gelatinilyticus TaxID=2835536 RepID=UPI001BCCCD54|nr:alpha/beta hydrolase [Croceicoccus gelatinilyticus]MBS7668251.1 alpha/beta hydrolase [Croceicoccus gelatinilyticus]
MYEQSIAANQLIKDAYAVVAEPEKLFDLQLRLERAQQRSEDALAIVNRHLGQIGELFDAVHLGPDADFSQMALSGEPATTERSSTLPILSLDKGLRVQEGADYAWAGPDVAPGRIAPAWLFGGQVKSQRTVRATINESAIGEIEYFRLFSSEDDHSGFMAMARLVGTEQGRELQFFRVGLEWEETQAARFAEVTGLSETEATLTGFIVRGRTLADYAQERNRSIGTARNQIKAVFRKLGINSQSELVSLYAGFVKSLSLQQISIPREDHSAFGQEVRLPDGSHLRFERYGKAGGRPVLWLHGAIEGPYLPSLVQQRAHAAGLELFAPWMPYFSEVVPPSDTRSTIEEFAAKLDAFCDAVQIDQCALLACSVSCAYGFAAAKLLPHRFVGCVGFALLIPLQDIADEDDVNPFWRAPLVLARSSPRTVDMLVRAVVRLAMRGEAFRYYDRLFKDSPLDLATLHRPDVRAVMRKAFLNRPDKAQRAMAHALLVQLLDWSDWLSESEVPTRIIVPEFDAVHKPASQLAFCERYGITPVGPVKGLGAFSMFQAPQLVFAELAALFDG